MCSGNATKLKKIQYILWNLLLEHISPRGNRVLVPYRASARDARPTVN